MITAIICAAGKGERAGLKENKILADLNGMPVLCHSLSVFSQCTEIDEIVIACRREDEPKILLLTAAYERPHIKLCHGGETRSESVFLALQYAVGDIVLIHDAARPFVTAQIVKDCIDCVTKHGSGVAVTPATDTVALTENGRIASTTDRAHTVCVQTPQGFYREKLLLAYEQAIKSGEQFTDDSGVYARYIESPAFFSGSVQNKKLTYFEDFRPAQRVGFGTDTHAFYGEGEGAPLIGFITLGGARIPSEKILKAHSDGDVLVHALMDALLSAAGLRDIGYYFPDTDERYAGADSMKLLAEVVKFVRAEGLRLKNASISVLAETPRLSPYIGDMQKNISEALGVPVTHVGIAAGTNEKLGYVGEKKGITCHATVLLDKI